MEASNKEVNQCTEPTSEDPKLTGDTSEVTPPTSLNIAPTTFPIWTHAAPTEDRHQDESKSESKYSNKPLMKKAVLQTYQDKNQHELQIFEANLKNHFDIYWGYIQNSN